MPAGYLLQETSTYQAVYGSLRGGIGNSQVFGSAPDTREGMGEQHFSQPDGSRGCPRGRELLTNALLEFDKTFSPGGRPYQVSGPRARNPLMPGSSIEG